MEKITITINSEPSTIAAAYAAFKDAIGASHTRWIVVTDDFTYISSANNVIVGAVGTPLDSEGAVYRSDVGQSYHRMRYFEATSTAACSIPSGTVFTVYIFPES